MTEMTEFKITVQGKVKKRTTELALTSNGFFIHDEDGAQLAVADAQEFHQAITLIQENSQVNLMVKSWKEIYQVPEDFFRALIIQLGVQQLIELEIKAYTRGGLILPVSLIALNIYSAKQRNALEIADVIVIGTSFAHLIISIIALRRPHIGLLRGLAVINLIIACYFAYLAFERSSWLLSAFSVLMGIAFFAVRGRAAFLDQIAATNDDTFKPRK